jgi:hypothetical protein
MKWKRRKRSEMVKERKAGEATQNINFFAI